MCPLGIETVVEAKVEAEVDPSITLRTRVEVAVIGLRQKIFA
jgi:hypothetical protein